MAHAAYIREKARAMRIERQFTIDELAERLALPRTTIYYWVRDLPIPGSGSGTGWPADALWLSRLTEARLRFSLQYHADQDLDELCKFWGGTLDVEPDTIKLQRKSNSNQLAGRQWRSRHGVIAVRVPDTLLRARLQAWMDQLRAEWQ
jgi:hypothetical protein